MSPRRGVLSRQGRIIFLAPMGVSMASYQWLELPFLRLKKAFTRVALRDDEPLAAAHARS